MKIIWRTACHWWWEFLAEIPRNVIIWNVRGSGFQYPQSIWVKKCLFCGFGMIWIHMCPFVPWMFLILMMFGCLALWEIAGMESHLIAVLCCAMLCFGSGFGWPRPFSRSSGSNRSKQRSGWIRVDWGWLAPICAEAWWEPYTRNTYRTMSHDIASYHTGHTAIPEQFLCSWLGICDVISLCVAVSIIFQSQCLKICLA